MSAQLTLTFSEPETWKPGTKKHQCRRQLNAGPGSCWHWWEGCPNSEERGCYFVYLRKKADKATNP